MPVVSRKRAPRQLTIKLLVLGDRKVGKSATIVRFLTHRFIGQYSSTKDWLYKQPLAHDMQKNMTTSVELLEHNCNDDLDIDHTLNGSNTLNTSLETRDKILWADAYIVMYAINDSNSFKRAAHCLDTIENSLNISNKFIATSGKQLFGRQQQHSLSSSPISFNLATHQPRRPILLLANKSDLNRDGRLVYGDEGYSLASLHQCLFSEISAAESHLGICNTIKALLAQANRLPDSQTINLNSNNNNNNTTSDIKISTKLNDNLHNSYYSIKSSFRRASLAIVSSKTFVNNSRKATFSSSSAKDEYHQVRARNNSEELCWIDYCELKRTNKALKEQQQQQNQQTVSFDDGKSANKKRSIFRYKDRRTNNITTSKATSRSNNNTPPGTMDDQSNTPAPLSSSTLGSFDDGTGDEFSVANNLVNNNNNNKQTRANESSSRQSIYDAIFKRNASNANNKQQQQNNSNSNNNNNNNTNHNDNSNYNSIINDLVKHNTTYSDIQGDYIERSLSRGSSGSSKSTDDGNRRSVSKLLHLMFNRPSSSIGSISQQHTTTPSDIHVNTPLPLHYQHSQSSYDNGLLTTRQHDTFVTCTSAPSSQYYSPYSNTNFHQVSCASQAATSTRRWYRMIGH